MSSSVSVERMGDVYALKLELATERQRRQLLDEHLRAAEERLDASAGSAAALQRLQHEFKLLHAQHDEALGELAAVAEDRSSLARAHSETVLHAQALGKELRAANCDNQRAQQELSKLKQELGESQRSLSMSQQEAQRLKATADDVSETVRELRAELDSVRHCRDVDAVLNQELAHRQALLAMHAGYVARTLYDALHDSRSAAWRMATAASALEDDYAAATEMAREAQSRAEACGTAAREAERQKELLRAELDAQSSVVKDLRDTVATLSRSQQKQEPSLSVRDWQNRVDDVPLQDTSRQILEKSMRELEEERAMSSRLRLALEDLRLGSSHSTEVPALKHAMAVSRYELVQAADREARLAAHCTHVGEECRLLHVEAEALGRAQVQWHGTVRRLEKQVGDLSAANATLAEEKRRCSDDIIALEQRVEEVLATAVQGDDPLLKAKHALLTSELDAYKATIGRLQDHLRAAETERIPVLVHRQHMQHVEAQRADLEQRVAVLLQRCASEAQRSHKLQAELDAKEEENMRLAPQHEMRRRLDMQQQELDAAAARFAQADALRIGAQKRLEDERVSSLTAAGLLQEKDRIVEGVAKQLLEAATEIESLTRERDEYRRMIEAHRERDKRDALFTLHRTSSQQSGNTPLSGNNRRLF